MSRGHCAGSWVPLTLQLAAPTTSPADSNRLGFRQPQKRKSTKKMKSGVTSVPPCSPFPQGAAKPCQQVPGPVASRAGEGRPRAPQREKPKPDAGRCLRRCVPRAGARCRPPRPLPAPGTTVPRRTVSLAWTVISPAAFWATHSYTFSSRGVRSGWILSTAPALPSNSIVCRGEGQRAGEAGVPGSPGEGLGACLSVGVLCKCTEAENQARM